MSDILDLPITYGEDQILVFCQNEANIGICCNHSFVKFANQTPFELSAFFFIIRQLLERALQTKVNGLLPILKQQMIGPYGEGQLVLMVQAKLNEISYIKMGVER